MNYEYIDTLRYKLHKRYDRLSSTKHTAFHLALQRFWSFLSKDLIFSSVLEDLDQRHSDLKPLADKITKGGNINLAEIPVEEAENITLAYFVIKECVKNDNTEVIGVSANPFVNFTGINNATDVFKAVFLDPLYDYLDENIDDQRIMLELLKSYKKKCEWFQRRHLHKLYEDETQKGEQNLKLHLFEYLHDKGLDFSIEPWSISGEVDFTDDSTINGPSIAEVKIFIPPSHNIEYIKRGFNQLYIYMQDHNQPFGYLVIFNTSEDGLVFSLAESTSAVPFISFGNKTIFFISINIFPHKVSASKRGKLKSCVITESDLIKILSEKHPSQLKEIPPIVN